MKDFKAFLASKNISEDQLKEKSAEELAGLHNEYNDILRKEINEAIESKVDKKDLETLKAELLDGKLEQIKQLNEALKEQGIAIKKLSEQEKADHKTPNSLLDALSGKRETLKEMKENGKGNLKLKVATVMLESTNISGGNVPVEQRLPGFDVVPTRQIRLMDIVNRGTAESNIISWVSQANKDGSAGGTTEGALKNQIDFDLVVDSEVLKKRTAFIKISKEMLEDVTFIQAEINNELMRELMLDIESQVYEGDDTGNNLNGIRTTAAAFSAAPFALSVDNANAVDVMRVAADNIKNRNHPAPNFILMNPSDVTALKLEKVTSTDKRYVQALQVVAGQLILDGMPIIETTLITQDEYLIGFFEFATVWDKGAIEMSVGFENDDFTKNLVTILAEWRGLNIVRTNKQDAFVAGTISTDAAALETA